MTGLPAVMVTGASGFIGQALLARLGEGRQFEVRAALRRTGCNLPPNVEVFAGLELSAETDWSAALCGVDCVVHTAARVHVMKERTTDAFAAYWCANVDGTMALARQAALHGVRRFIFVSSIKVNGERTVLGEAYSAADQPAPVDPYGVSKLEAENGLLQLAQETGMQVTIVRPPLVYGPGVKANFANLMCYLDSGMPLPLGNVKNKRSLVAVDNLVDLLVTCMCHPAAANRIFLVSDGEDLSTPELLRRLGIAMGVHIRLWKIPQWTISLGAALLGKSVWAQRLCGSLQVDMTETCEVLGWMPKLSIDEALRRTAEHFLRERAH